MTARIQWRESYGPRQLRDLLGLTDWQVERLGKTIPAPDLPGGRWSQETARRLYRRRRALLAKAGSIPDVGMYRAADILTERLGLPVSVDAIRELWRTGLIPAAGTYRGERLYDGRALEQFSDIAALNQAEIDGYLLRTEEAMTLLGCRERDWRHLLAKGWLRPTKYVRGQWNTQVAMYRAKDIRDLRTRSGIDWDAVRAVPPGRRSLLATLDPAR